AGGFVAFLMAAAVWIATRPGPAVEAGTLANKVEVHRDSEKPTAAERLHGSPEQIAPRAAELEEFRADPHFAQLPDDLQQYVKDRLAELKDYEAFYRKLLEARPPADARSLDELQHVEDALKTSLAVPRQDWGQT